MISQLKADGHRVLIFSGMTRMLDVVQDFLTLQNFSFERLDGSVRGSERFDTLHRFCKDGALNSEHAPAFVFLLSVRAGGQGLNLTEADTCIFLDSDFNPQIDLQAEDRVHRIGQQKPVLVLRFLSQKTVEEGILLSARKKEAVAQRVLGVESVRADGLDCDELGPRALLDAILVGAQAAIDAESQSSPSAVSGCSHALWQAASATVVDAAAQCKDSFDRHFLSCDWNRVLSRHGINDGEEELVAGGSGAAYELEYQPLELGSQSLDTSRLQGKVSSASARLRQPGAEAGPRRSKEKPSADAVSAAAAAKAEAAQTRRAAKWATAGYVSQRLPPPCLEDDASPDVDEIIAESEGEGSVQGGMTFVVGNVARPSCVGVGRQYILHCVDCSGAWPDRGVFKALSDAHGPQIETAYEFAANMRDLHLGDAHCFPLNSSSSGAGAGPCAHSVVLLVCLERLSDGSRRIELSSFRLSIQALRLHCSFLSPHVTCHFHTPMPPPPPAPGTRLSVS